MRTDSSDEMPHNSCHEEIATMRSMTNKHGTTILNENKHYEKYYMRGMNDVS